MHGRPARGNTIKMLCLARPSSRPCLFLLPPALFNIKLPVPCPAFLGLPWPALPTLPSLSCLSCPSLQKAARFHPCPAPAALLPISCKISISRFSSIQNLKMGILQRAITIAADPPCPALTGQRQHLPSPASLYSKTISPYPNGATISGHLHWPKLRENT